MVVVITVVGGGAMVPDVVAVVVVVVVAGQGRSNAIRPDLFSLPVEVVPLALSETRT